ncbi:hypothetical protein ACFHYQ_10420 [Sphaerimonospora cavernae]|uniref:Uncharacterized protein n=1 Tax=Sphaerimonospora cavernae TaxID=1740611 RepID=A0ABV6U3X8_9ACTN
MTVTRLRHVRRLRPLVLITAMLAPAILAVAMLMAEFAGYREAARGSVAGEGKMAAQASRASGAGTSENALPPETSGVTRSPAEVPVIASQTDVGMPGSAGDVTVFPPTITPPAARGRGRGRSGAAPGAETVGDGAGRTPLGPAPQSSAPAPTPSASSAPYGTAPGSIDHRKAGHRKTDRQNADPGQPGRPGPDTAGSDPNGTVANSVPADDDQAGQAVQAVQVGETGGVPVAPGAEGQVGEAQVDEGQRTTSVPAGRDAVLEPTRVPEPFGPIRVYEGLILIPRPEPVRQAPPAVVKRQPRTTAPKERSEPAEVETPLTCSLEWRDTWLWEFCREHSLTLDAASLPGDTAQSGLRRGTERHDKAPERDEIGG